MTEDTVRHYTERYGYAGSTEWCPYHRDLRHLLNLSSRNPNVDSPPVFIITAVLTERKAVDVAIRGLARAEVPGTLLVVGGGPLQPSLEALAAKLLPGRVVFTGAVGYSEVPGLLSNGSAFLFPSRHDGFGMSVMEALAAGLPVLASNEVSAARQYIKNGINGWLLPADDVDAWAAAIRRMTTTGFLAPKLTERVRASLAGYDATADAARLARFLEAL